MAHLTLLALIAIPLLVMVMVLYLWHVNRCIKVVPPEARIFSPQRWTKEKVREVSLRVAAVPMSRTVDHLPAATGRRYIIIGGSGFIGGWVILHLLARGEAPHNIRNISTRPPRRKDMLSSDVAKIDFKSADIRDVDALRTAFRAPWPIPTSSSVKGITVIHCAAGMRFYERHKFHLSRSYDVNVLGTQNALDAAREVGAEIFLFVSSASISISKIQYWVWPWQKQPKSFVQVAHDNPDEVATEPKHGDYFSNYPYTKIVAESLVRKANNPINGFLTGCLRPGNAVFGSGGDLNAGDFLTKSRNPSWIGTMIQSFTYVENVSYAVLLYESRLLQTDVGPKLGGQSFLICDAEDPIPYNDLYLALEFLSQGRVRFPQLPVSPLLLIAPLVELYYYVQSRFFRFLPEVSAQLRNLQPAVINMVTLHYKIDDSRARLSPQEGGLGYQPLWSTLDGLCRLVQDCHDTLPGVA